MSRGIDSKLIEYRKSVLIFDGSGHASLGITFEEAFNDVPQMMVVEDGADVSAGATYAATSVTYSGFTLTVTGSQYVNTRRTVYWIAHERS